jgi:FtsP/CotA-like multicopper oxidase with cupredoxin domain
VVVKQGAIEDWRIVNLDAEAHAFHIHQLHFQVLSSPNPGNEAGTMRDTINIPGWDGKNPTPTFTNLRMDFRGDIVGTFLYHCHILEHEDNGMMAKIRVNG